MSHRPWFNLRLLPVLSFKDKVIETLANIWNKCEALEETTPLYLLVHTDEDCQWESWPTLMTNRPPLLCNYCQLLKLCQPARFSTSSCNSSWNYVSDSTYVKHNTSIQYNSAGFASGVLVTRLEEKAKERAKRGIKRNWGRNTMRVCERERKRRIGEMWALKYIF